ncbi:hypothetical protein ABEG63_17800 [Chryseobacterium sp. C39-AII1]|uniref:hypothetical protein n=1 Tax=Chryseobacterium sp. C39-AII1 TaxID=3080332 RepID=UPI003207F191
MYGLGGSWNNTGGSFTSSENISLGYSGNFLSLNTGFSEGGIGDAIIDIPGVTLTKKAGWGNLLQNHFNSYMNKIWNGTLESNETIDRIINHHFLRFY